MSNDMIRSESQSTPSDDSLNQTTISFDETDDPASEIVLSIVEHVADLTDEDVTELPPLYDSVNPGALADLMSTPQSDDRSVDVSFRYQGCRVTVSSVGDVTIEEELQ
ncbi:HalOD1 output domain-containing protein [Natranaeroarchaeum sulfidigenes]|uniref:Halobacterial output domain-containing protein n=1 Tax=Natranaeroarchaeum sulfidigenes TaxID=2784880 RepID=A0A897MJK9_9EURY|nr:HalOD1 output domain-containing protein [Natranaeroarchaeum sulfidigenes]QSG02290.1 Uncharacterized protein AArcS_1069 [Natranaeroarchaeum sulfidigenes]